MTKAVSAPENQLEQTGAFMPEEQLAQATASVPDNLLAQAPAPVRPDRDCLRTFCLVAC